MKNSNFKPTGYYTVSNCLSYEVEIDESGDAARLRYPKGYVTSWLPIEHMWENDLDLKTYPVIDPNGYNIPLDLVMKIDY